MTTTRDTALRRIRLLLNQAGAAGTEAEAATFLAKATQLQTKYSVTPDELRDDEESDELGMITVSGLQKNAGYIKARREIVFGLSTIFNCRAVIASDRSYVRLYGHESDLRFVQAMFNSISLQLDTELARLRGDRSAKTSFAHGYVRRVIARVMESRTAAEQDVIRDEPGTALVLRDRAAIVQQYFSGAVGGRLRSSYKNTSIRDTGAFMQGVAAGNRANIGQTAVTSRRRAIEG